MANKNSQSWLRFEEERQKLFDLLKQLSYRRSAEPFMLRSGAMSSVYFDGRQTSLTARGAVLIGSLFTSLIHFLAEDVEAIGGPTVGADPLVSSVIMYEGMGEHRLRPKPVKIHTGFLIRKEVKLHGITDEMVGANHLLGGTKVAICDDVITSGRSMLDAVRVAKWHTVRGVQRSFDVRIAVALIDREEGGGKEHILKEVPQVVPLFRQAEFVSGKCLPLEFRKS